MSVDEVAAVLTHRHSAYAFALIGLALALALLYAFNDVTFFGAVAQ